MRETTLIQQFKAQNQQNSFNNRAIVAISAHSQALERVMTGWGKIPLLLVLSIIWPGAIRRMIRRAEIKLMEEAQNG